MFEWLLEDGRIVLVAMAILLAEVSCVRLVPSGKVAAFLANAIAGLALLGALYAAINDLPAAAIAGCLAIGLIAHLAYLATLRGR